MKVIASAAIVACLAGCTSYQPAPPVDVMLVPNDCANQQMIIGYLTQQAQRPQGSYETAQDYERTRSELRHRVWNMRYHCNPV